MSGGPRRAELIEALKHAAQDHSPVQGLTHSFYRYPARFSPLFAAEAIRAFSSVGDLVLDPFAGGGTTVVEALANGRHGVGTDINELATFVGRAKTLLLRPSEEAELLWWANRVVPDLRYHTPLRNGPLPEGATHNLSSPTTRSVLKLVALALESLPWPWSSNIEILGRAAVLSTSQWAFDGRRNVPGVAEFRQRLQATVLRMISALRELRVNADRSGGWISPRLVTLDANEIDKAAPFMKGTQADLVVTSPPYRGIHVLYHRWQVLGRKETPAPYWITACADGNGASHYTIAARCRPDDEPYFSRLLSRMAAIRRVMKENAVMVQLVGFSEPERHLPMYLRMMEEAGFREHRDRGMRRIWRDVPGRRWHAVQRRTAPASREVVLVHISS